MSAEVSRNAPAPGRRLRRAAVWLHRWVGLVITLFLVSAGVTGSLIAFNDELEALLSPRLFRVAPPAAPAARLGPLELRERVLQRYPGTAINWVDLQPPEAPDRTVVFGLEPASGSKAALANDEVFVDPYSGAIVGERRHGDLTQGPKNVMPFVYRLHESLALGVFGQYVLGIAALLWTLDCFVGFYLTLPQRSRRTAAGGRHRPKQWAKRWAPAWKLRWQGGNEKLVFDLHRAGGLWAWAMLFVFAWSSVGFNLGEVYRPVMGFALGYLEPGPAGPSLARPLTTPPIGWERARRIGADAMAEEARARGFAVRRERLIHYDPDRGLYEYRTLSTLDVGSKLGNTTLYLDAMRGRVLRVDLPTGVGAGNTATAWLMALHTAGIGGMPMQVFISLMGGVVVLLSVTGLVIWWRKRRARLQGRHRAAAHKPRGQPGPRAAHGPDAAAIRIPQQNADPYPPNRKNPMTALSQFAITGKWPAVHPERIQLYSLPTPNGVKVSIMLEETGLPYEPHLVRFDMNEQLSPQFLSLNPNNKIPAILDPDGPDGQPLALFESGAILIYLAEKSGQFMPRDAAGRYQTIQWLMFQMGGIGPMFGQLGFFNKFAGKDYEDKRPRDRYVAESRRLLGVLDQRLADRAWIMGDDYTIADMATFPWVNNLIGFYEAADLVGYADFAHVARALNAFVARPGVVKGLGIPARPKAR